jgi:hypothetical protein
LTINAFRCDFCAFNKDTDRFQGKCLLPWLEGRIYVPKDGFSEVIHGAVKLGWAQKIGLLRGVV